MITEPLAEQMFEAGLSDLIPVIPPGASMAPSSKVSPSSVGKIPGRRLDNGLWVSGNWRTWTATLEDVKRWRAWGANVGLRADRFPGVDIDCADETLAQMIEGIALAQLGPAPLRVGNWPKRLLMYRTDAPFPRRRIWLIKGESQYLVEILGEGQQYVVSGTHPTTLRPYEWVGWPYRSPATEPLTTIDSTKADAFLTYLQQEAERIGYETKRAEGTSATRRQDQREFEAPSIDELRGAMERIPNTIDLFPGWDEFIKMLYAMRAAAGPEEEDGFDIFAGWASRWEGHGARHADSNNPDARRALWRRTRGPYSVGWGWIAEMARPYGYNDATFPTEGEAPALTATPGERPPPAYRSEQWLATEVVERCSGILRYNAASEQWLVWNRGRWQPDAEMLAEDTVKLELRGIADQIARQGSTEKEKKSNLAAAVAICSAAKVSNIARLVKMDRAIAVSPELLDLDPWILNTPAGIVDLLTGRVREPDPDLLCTRSVAVAPDQCPTPLWDSYLIEATAGDRGLQQYLQRLSGYALTGSVREHQFTFIHGTGGNGKGIFLGVLMGILGTYHRNSPMDTFVASHTDRHPTELAMLAGARLVTASETGAGKAWDEPKLKRMTGGDPITARHMREDFFTYLPQFKLVFIGNHKPEIRNLDKAMRRRTHLVPFTVTPQIDDKELGVKLREEWPGILAWMIEGCLKWQKLGLLPPQSVLDATEDYFDESNPVGQWLEECCEPAGVDEWIPLVTLFDSWREWQHRRGDQYVGKIQRLGSELATQYAKRKNPRKRVVEFAGLKINGKDPLEGIA